MTTSRNTRIKQGLLHQNDALTPTLISQTYNDLTSYYRESSANNFSLQSLCTLPTAEIRETNDLDRCFKIRRIVSVDRQQRISCHSSPQTPRIKYFTDDIRRLSGNEKKLAASDLKPKRQLKQVQVIPLREIYDKKKIFVKKGQKSQQPQVRLSLPTLATQSQVIQQLNTIPEQSVQPVENDRQPSKVVLVAAVQDQLSDFDTSKEIQQILDDKNIVEEPAWGEQQQLQEEQPEPIITTEIEKEKNSYQVINTQSNSSDDDDNQEEKSELIDEQELKRGSTQRRKNFFKIDADLLEQLYNKPEMHRIVFNRRQIKGTTFINAEILQSKILETNGYAASPRQRPFIRLEEELQTLGSGGFGTVAEVIDLNTLSVRAAKKFNQQRESSIDSFLEELHINLELKQVFNDQIDQLRQKIILCEDDVDYQTRTLYYESGCLSLTELHTCYMKRDPEAKFKPSDLLYFFVKCCELVLFLYQRGYYHSDIKDGNIVFVESNEKNENIKGSLQQNIHCYVMKFIDLGACTNSLEAVSVTKHYFCSPMRDYEGTELKQIVLKSQDERFKTELFQVFRTIQRLMLSKEDDIKFYATCFLDEEGKVQLHVTWHHLQELDEIIFKRYELERSQDPEFAAVLDFITTKGWSEDYTLADIEEMLRYLYEKRAQDLKCFYDVHNVIASTLSLKRSAAGDRDGMINRLVGVTTYVDLQCAHSENYMPAEDLMQLALNFILGGQENTEKCLVIIGQSGGGKSLFLVQLLLRINGNRDLISKKCSCIYIKCRDYALQDNQEGLVKEVQNQMQSVQGTNKIIVVLDGFDEFNNTEILLAQEIERACQPHAFRLIVTSRLGSVSRKDLEYCFSSQRAEGESIAPSVVYICPFGDAQRESCIKKFTKSAKELRRLDIKIGFPDDERACFELFQKVPILRELSRVPFTLRLILTNFKQLRVVGQRSGGSSISRADIYRIFVHSYYHNELKRLALFKKFHDLLKDVYDLQVADNELDQFELVHQQLFLYVDHFNAHLALHLYHRKTLLFAYTDAGKILDGLILQKQAVSQNDFLTYSEESEQTDQMNKRFLMLELFLSLTPLEKAFSASDLSARHNNELQYLHKSVYEYFLALGIIKDSIQMAQTQIQSVSQDTSEEPQQQQLAVFSSPDIIAQLMREGKWNPQYGCSRPVQDESESLRMLADVLQWQHTLAEKRLFASCLRQTILASRYLRSDSAEDQKLIQLCANAATILNVATFQLGINDLHNVQLPGADLSNSWLGGVNFKDADLRRVKFAHSFLDGANFEGANFTDTTFGQLANLQGHYKSVTRVAVSRDGHLVASASKDSTVRIWDVHQSTELVKLHGNPLFSFDTLAIKDEPLLICGGQSNGEIIVWFGPLPFLEYKCLKQTSSFAVLSLEFAHAPHSKLLVSAFFDGAVRVWNYETGVQVCALNAHSTSATAVALTPDDRLLLSASNDGRIFVWNFSNAITNIKEKTSMLLMCIFERNMSPKIALSNRSMKASSVHELRTDVPSPPPELANCVHSIAIAADGSQVLSAHADGSLRIWKLPTLAECEKFKATTKGAKGQLLLSNPTCEIQAHAFGALCAVFSVDGQHIFSSGADKAIKLWRIDTQLLVKMFEGHHGCVTSIATFGDGKRLVSGSLNNNVRIWDIFSGAQFKNLEGHAGAIMSLSHCAQEQLLATASEDGTVCLWDDTSGQRLATLQAHTAPVLAVILSKDGKLAISASADGSIIIWEVSQSKKIATFKDHGDAVLSIALTPDGTQIISASADNYVRVWDIKQRQKLATLREEGTVSVNCVAATHDNKFVSGGSIASEYSENTEIKSDCVVHVWSTETRKCLHTLRYANGLSVLFLRFSADGAYLAAALQSRELLVWDTTRFTLECIFPQQTHAVTAVLFASIPSGNSGTPNNIQIPYRLFSSSEDGILRVWDCAQKTCIRELEGHYAAVRTLEISSDSLTLFSGDTNRSLLAWDVPACLHAPRIDLHATVTCISASQNGELVVAGTQNGYLFVWNTQSEVIQQRIEAVKNASILCVDVSQDAHFLAYGIEKEDIAVWKPKVPQQQQGMLQEDEEFSFLLSNDLPSENNKQNRFKNMRYEIALRLPDSKAVGRIAFMQGGKKILTGHLHQYIVRIYSIPEGIVIQQYENTVFLQIAITESIKAPPVQQEKRISLEVSTKTRLVKVQGDSLLVSVRPMCIKGRLAPNHMLSLRRVSTANAKGMTPTMLKLFQGQDDQQ